MKVKKYIIGLMTCSMLLGVGYFKPVEAIDFSKNEAKYMSLCSSSQLTNDNKKTCESFNSYLKEKNKKLNKELQSQKSDAQNTANSLSAAEKKLNSINNSISSKEAEIKYVENSIQNTQNEIDQNSQEIKDRMYVMQSYMNENTFINYIFGANNFTDMLSRIDSFNTLTYSDKELVKTMVEKKKAIESQKVTLENAKKVLESQKVEQAAIQTQYETLLEEQRKKVAATQVDANVAASQSKQIDESLTAFYENSKKDDVGHVTQLPVPSTPSTNNNTSSNTNNNQSSNTNNEQDSNTDQTTNNNNSNENQNSSNNNQNSSTNTNQNNSSITESNAALGVKIANYALAKQGSRYYWGASGPTYFDCSGLVYWAHKQAGVRIGRTTAAGYAGSGKSVSYNNLQIGDVITFNYGRGVAHIGIYIGNGRMVHASGKGSETVGQDPNQCVKVTSIAPGSYFHNYIYNCRRLY
ncbi:NlpC/P60 family protein [Faecalibacillus faecis]|nr:C40 family peptidase [Faecalibacillus faecis]MCB7488611.1 NlpC/P60 family protein [Faecalibacillus faecis]MCG4592330.1 NlpC/P60 family protein [Faecalibacillus faecis]SCH24144.1 Probable endopeptidase cgR_2070 precursor [uncultured Clostridium sp.]